MKEGKFLKDFNQNVKFKMVQSKPHGFKKNLIKTGCEPMSKTNNKRGFESYRLLDIVTCDY